MNSMTGYGRAEARTKKYVVQLDLSSVNSRFLEFSFRLPKTLSVLEPKIRDLISQQLIRGKITITINLSLNAEYQGETALDPNQAKAYYRQLLRVKRALKIPGDVEMDHVLSNPDLLMGRREDVDAARIWPTVKGLLQKACLELIAMRRKEGRNLERDMVKRIKTATRVVSQVERLSPKNVSEYRTRLENRIRELSSDVEIEPRRLAEEVTLFADRSDVTEECIRLKSHLGMFQDALRTQADVGKRLNFILQEMHREANTLGSKAASGDISELAIRLKEEIEKLREQAQNIE